MLLLSVIASPQAIFIFPEFAAVLMAGVGKRSLLSERVASKLAYYSGL